MLVGLNTKSEPALVADVPRNELVQKYTPALLYIPDTTVGEEVNLTGKSPKFMALLLKSAPSAVVHVAWMV